MNTWFRWLSAVWMLALLTGCADEPEKEQDRDLEVNEDDEEGKNAYTAIGLCAADAGDSADHCPESCFEVRGVRADKPSCTEEAPLLGCADRPWSPYPSGYDTTDDMPPTIWSKQDGFGYTLREEYKDWTRESQDKDSLTRGCWNAEDADCVSARDDRVDPCANE